METYQTKPLSIRIEPFGECTLLPLELLPKTRRSYEKLQEVALTLFDLQELPGLSHDEIQEAVMTITRLLTQYGQPVTFGATIWISWLHLSCPMINIKNKVQEKVLCVTSVELLFLEDEEDEDLLPDDQVIEVQVMYEELQPNNIRKIEDADIVYGLFLGTI